MKRSVIETLLGGVVILVAAVFLLFSYKTANISAGSGGYDILANFSSIGGLNTGDSVAISGVKIGTVTSVSLDPETFLARVHMNVDDSVKLPVDTAAVISSESLLGGQFLSLEPGSDEELIQPGGTIQFTQAPQNLEQLLGKFIFSVTGDKDKKDGEAGTAEGGSAPAAGAEAPEAVPAAPVSDAPSPVPSPAEKAPAAVVAPAEAAVPAPASVPAAPAPAPVTSQPLETQDAAPAAAPAAPAQP